MDFHRETGGKKCSSVATEEKNNQPGYQGRREKGRGGKAREKETEKEMLHSQAKTCAKKVTFR